MDEIESKKCYQVNEMKSICSFSPDPQMSFPVPVGGSRHQLSCSPNLNAGG